MEQTWAGIKSRFCWVEAATGSTISSLWSILWFANYLTFNVVYLEPCIQESLAPNIDGPQATESLVWAQVAGTCLLSETLNGCFSAGELHQAMSVCTGLPEPGLVSGPGRESVSSFAWKLGLSRLRVVLVLSSYRLQPSCILLRLAL